jgi:hypothetical protein
MIDTTTANTIRFSSRFAKPALTASQSMEFGGTIKSPPKDVR